MSRASWSCRYETAFLDRPKEWLALKCAVKPRSLERHLPQLAKLELLVWNGSGFRLPRFYEFNRQIGGEVRQNGGAYKEGMYGNVCEKTPSLPLTPGEGRQTNQAGTQGAGKPGSPEDLPRETASALAGRAGWRLGGVRSGRLSHVRAFADVQRPPVSDGSRT